MNLEKPTQLNSKERKEKVESKVYSLESGTQVRLNSREILPDNVENLNNSKGIILIPGWEAEAENKTTLSLGEDFANESKTRTLTITTETNDRNSLFDESIAISKFIKEKKLESIKIVGYSIGGDKAMNVVYLLQDDPEIKIEGLILLASTGLYDQKPKELTVHLLKDSFVKTPLNMPKSENKSGDFKKWANVAKDLGSNVFSKTVSSPSHVVKILNRINETSKQNERASELKVPIVLINGKEDSVSDYRKIISTENLFKSSPYVRLIKPEKSSNHGLSYFRPKSIARVSTKLIDKFYQ